MLLCVVGLIRHDFVIVIDTEYGAVDEAILFG